MLSPPPSHLSEPLLSPSTRHRGYSHTQGPGEDSKPEQTMDLIQWEEVGLQLQDASAPATAPRRKRALAWPPHCQQEINQINLLPCILEIFYSF